MNWFRALKIAAPFETGQSDYMQIGHCNYDGVECPQKLEREELWWLDQNFNFASAISEEDVYHNSIFGEDRDEVAHGRYTRDERYPKGAATIIWNWQFKQSPLKLRAAQRKVRTILEKQYGREVQILEFA